MIQKANPDIRDMASDLVCRVGHNLLTGILGFAVSATNDPSTSAEYAVRIENDVCCLFCCIQSADRFVFNLGSVQRC